MAEGNVKIIDEEGNVIKTDKATYDKKNEIILTYKNTELNLKEGYKLIGKNISAIIHLALPPPQLSIVSK